MDSRVAAVKLIVAGYESRLRHKRIFFPPYIPSAKLAKAIRGFAPGAEGEEALFLFDNSPLGDARSGILLTTGALYSLTEESKHKFDLAAIRSVSMQKFFGDKRLLVDGRYVGLSGFAARKEFPLIVEMFADIARLYHPEAGASSPVLREGVAGEAAIGPAGPSRENQGEPLTSELIIGRVVAFSILAVAGGALYFVSSLVTAMILKDKSIMSSAPPIVLSLILLSGLPKLSAQITQALVNVRLKSESRGANSGQV